MQLCKLITDADTKTKTEQMVVINIRAKNERSFIFIRSKIKIKKKKYLKITHFYLLITNIIPGITQTVKLLKIARF